MREYKIRIENITKRMEEELIKNDINHKSDKITSFFRSNTINVNTFHELIVEIAELSNKNPDVVLFYRGQQQDYRAMTHFTLYPSI